MNGENLAVRRTLWVRKHKRKKCNIPLVVDTGDPIALCRQVSEPMAQHKLSSESRPHGTSRLFATSCPVVCSGNL